MADGKPGRPATGQIPVRTVRLGPVWEETKAAAKAAGERHAAFIERALRRELALGERRHKRERSHD